MAFQKGKLLSQKATFCCLLTQTIVFPICFFGQWHYFDIKLNTALICKVTLDLFKKKDADTFERKDLISLKHLSQIGNT